MNTNINKEISEFMISNFNNLLKLYNYSDEIISEFYTTYDYKNIERILKKDKFFIEYDQKTNNISGILHVGFHSEDKSIGLIFWIFVDKNSKGLGIGKLLFKKSIQYFKTKKIEKIYSCSYIENNISKNLHQNIGFEIRKISANQIGYQKFIFPNN